MLNSWSDFATEISAIFDKYGLKTTQISVLPLPDKGIDIISVANDDRKLSIKTEDQRQLIIKFYRKEVNLFGATLPVGGNKDGW